MLVLKDGVDLPARIATGSPRRRVQLRIIYPKAEFVEIREMWIRGLTRSLVDMRMPRCWRLPGLIDWDRKLGRVSFKKLLWMNCLQ